MLDCKTPSYLVLGVSSYLDKKESSEEISSGLKENVGWDSPNMLDKPLWNIKLRLLPYKPTLLVTPTDTQILSEERLLMNFS